MPPPVDRGFLRAAIEDLQGTIRAIDMKAEVLLIAMTVPLMDATGISNTVAALVQSRHLFVQATAALSAIGAIVSLFAASLFTLRVLRGAHNPASALPERSGARGSFYAGHIYKFTRADVLRDRLVHSSKSVAEYLSELPTSEEDVQLELAFEQMKLAYICGRKIAMFNAAVRCIAVSVYCGLAMLLLHVFF